MTKSDFPQLVDVPKANNCSGVFWSELKKVPAYIQAEWESRGTHGGTGTTWAGGYDTYEIYDERRPEWPTEEVEEWRDRIEFAITSHLHQNRISVR
jgi:hypothetical protein